MRSASSLRGSARTRKATVPLGGAVGGKPDEPGTLDGARTGSQTTLDGGFFKSSSHLSHARQRSRVSREGGTGLCERAVSSGGATARNHAWPKQHAARA